MVQVFPKDCFAAESEYKSILDILVQLEKRESSDRRPWRIRDLEAEAGQGASCNQLFAYFILKLALVCGTDAASVNFIQEAILVICLLRKYLNEKGYQLNQEGNFNHKPSLDAEYCAGKNNPISVLTADTGLSSFFYEYFPCYFSNLLRYFQTYSGKSSLNLVSNLHRSFTSYIWSKYF